MMWDEMEGKTLMDRDIGREMHSRSQQAHTKNKRGFNIVFVFIKSK